MTPSEKCILALLLQLAMDEGCLIVSRGARPGEAQSGVEPVLSLTVEDGVIRLNTRDAFGGAE